MPGRLDKILHKELNRRTFIKGSAAVTAAAALGLSLSGNENSLLVANAAAAEPEGRWQGLQCWHNCGGSCPNMGYVVDGVVVRQKTDDTHPDSWDYPQKRSCVRGRSQRMQIFGADRLKYPMKRKHWEPLTGGDKSLRGRDEWVRISWEEALDYAAAELKNAKEKYGNRSIFGWGDGYLANAEDAETPGFGGHIAAMDTSSYGVCYYINSMIGMRPYGWGGSPDRYELMKSDTIVMCGMNPAWGNPSMPSYYFYNIKKRSNAQFIHVGPSYNFSADLLGAKWMRVRPGTDTAFFIAVAYTMLTEDDKEANPIVDWEFLDRYTVGFDAQHMPADAKLNENYKDYLLGKYDGIPKTAEWASEICGTPAEDIIWFAREMRKDKKVSLLHGNGPARANNAESFPQAFMAVACMGGHFGKPGHNCDCSIASTSGNGGSFSPGTIATSQFGGTSGGYGTFTPAIPNPLQELVVAPEAWEAILNGKYRRTHGAFQDITKYPVEEREIDIHIIWHGLMKSALTTYPGAKRGIEAHRKVDFVWSQSFSLNPCAAYADIVVPITTRWERRGTATNSLKEGLYFSEQVCEPLYEAKDDSWIAYELSKRLGLPVPGEYNAGKPWFNAFRGLYNATYVDENGKQQSLITFTQADIDACNQKAEEPLTISDDDPTPLKPKEGVVGLDEFRYQRPNIQRPRKEGDGCSPNRWNQDFIDDPEGKPLANTVSGKMEIYCQKKADVVNAMGRSTLKPYPTYIPALNGYESTYSDWDNKVKGDFPFQLTNVHYPRRSHSILDNNPWLREAHTNPLFVNADDAAKKGLKEGDVVLITSPYAQALRPVSISERIMPGVVELPHGAWPDVDEETGIDKAGCDNYLMGGVTTGCGVSGYNTQIVNYEKYTGKIKLAADCDWPQRIIDYK